MGRLIAVLRQVHGFKGKPLKRCETYKTAAAVAFVSLANNQENRLCVLLFRTGMAIIFSG
jgi:hypothetical protein